MEDAMNLQHGEFKANKDTPLDVNQAVKYGFSLDCGGERVDKRILYAPAIEKSHVQNSGNPT